MKWVRTAKVLTNENSFWNIIPTIKLKVTKVKDSQAEHLRKIQYIFGTTK